MKNMLKMIYVVSLLFIVTSAQLSHAGILTQTFTNSFAFGPMSIVDSKGGSSKVDTASQTTNLTGFNSALGTLQSVDIVLDSGWGFRTTLFANDPDLGPQDSVFGEGFGSIRLAAKVLLPGTGLSSIFRKSDETCTGIQSCLETTSRSGSFDSVLGLGASLNDFIDIGSFGIDLERRLVAKVTDCGTDDDCFVTNDNNYWKGNLSVTYTYDETPSSNNVPEPSSLGLMLMGLGLVRLSKAQKIVC